MFHTKLFDAQNPITPNQKTQIVDFLFDNLEKYGDPKPGIAKAIDYAMEVFPSFGGQVFALYDDDVLKGASVVNRTGMGGYVPDNLLVYIATHKNHRGEGLGKNLMQEILEQTQGDIALHVEPNNPAKKLYEKFGFENPYLEMRLKH